MAWFTQNRASGERVATQTAFTSVYRSHIHYFPSPGSRERLDTDSASRLAATAHRGQAIGAAMAGGPIPPTVMPVAFSICFLTSVNTASPAGHKLKQGIGIWRN